MVKYLLGAVIGVLAATWLVAIHLIVGRTYVNSLTGHCAVESQIAKSNPMSFPRREINILNAAVYGDVISPVKEIVEFQRRNSVLSKFVRFCARIVSRYRHISFRRIVRENQITLNGSIRHVRPVFERRDFVQTIKLDDNVAFDASSWPLPRIQEFNLAPEDLVRAKGRLRLSGGSYPRTISEISLTLSLLKTSFSSGSTAARSIDGALRLVSSGNHFAPLADGNISVNAGSKERSPSSYNYPYLQSVLAILTGLSLAFYVFWNVEFGPQYWRWQIWLVLSVASLSLFGYGFGLLLDVAVKSR